MVPCYFGMLPDNVQFFFQDGGVQYGVTDWWRDTIPAHQLVWVRVC